MESFKGSVPRRFFISHRGTYCNQQSRTSKDDYCEVFFHFFSFLFWLQSIGVLHEKLEEKRLLLEKYGLDPQPLPVVVGDVENPSQCLVVVDNFHYEVDAPLTAVDVCFKLYVPRARRQISSGGRTYLALSTKSSVRDHY